MSEPADFDKVLKTLWDGWEKGPTSIYYTPPPPPRWMPLWLQWIRCWIMFLGWRRKLR